jgi:hypothetical protein
LRQLGWFPIPQLKAALVILLTRSRRQWWVVGKDAPPEAIDFLKYISTLNHKSNRPRLVCQCLWSKG